MARILIVEDESTVLRVLSRICLKRGYNVTECEDAEQAMLIVRESPRFDLVITDIILPGKSGLELLVWLNKRGYAQRMVVMTAYPNQEFLEFAKKNGVIGVLNKPFGVLTEVGSRLDHWLGTKGKGGIELKSMGK
jgi:CheY-like chemotaxis protein